MPERGQPTENGLVNDAMHLLARRLMELQLANELVGNFDRPYKDVKHAEDNVKLAVRKLHQAIDALPPEKQPKGWDLDDES